MFLEKILQPLASGVAEDLFAIHRQRQSIRYQEAMKSDSKFWWKFLISALEGPFFCCIFCSEAG